MKTDNKTIIKLSKLNLRMLPPLLLSLFIFCESLCAGDKLDSLLDNAVKLSLIKLENSATGINDSTLFPTYATKELKWKLKGPDDWTSGF